MACGAYLKCINNHLYTVYSSNSGIINSYNVCLLINEILLVAGYIAIYSS